MATAKDWAANDNAKKPRSAPHIVEEHVGEGKIRVHEFGSKKEAHEFGMGLRRAGKQAFIFEKGSKWAQSAQNPGSVVGGGDQPRDEQGRFTSK